MIPAQYYQLAYLYLIIFLSIIACVNDSKKTYRQLCNQRSNWVFPMVFCLLSAIWMGHRPISGIFGDTPTYAGYFRLMQLGDMPNYDGEWVWTHFMYICAQFMDVSDCFTLIDIGYIGFMLWGCYKLMPNGGWTAMLFCLGAFSFFSYGTNGIRNGLACSIVIVALAYACGNKTQKLFAAIMAFIAFNIHHSTSLPILMAIASMFFIRSFKQAYIFWILSIAMSLVAGSAITSIFATLGFDDRLSYLQSEMDSSSFSHTGFRWDFLLYSMMPIVLGYYVVIKRGIRNTTYELLLNTYTLSNAFWVMVIRANFSNRFAYLSWFLYPIVLVYPLLKLDIWEDSQGRKLAGIMLAHIGFTWFMNVIYY